ncbi:MAG TPA: DUF4340 domain-containing protein [Candidatus Acidoferrum sp.]|nr:DUF4340 domain-containing protein [Candidatus Acidoferrum sp.]
MIKKSTLIVFLCAVILGGAVYYVEWRNSKKPPAPEDSSKPAFTMQAAADITSLTIFHPDKTDQPPIQFANHGGDWTITQPLETGADQSSVSGIVDGLADARISQTEPGSPDRLKAYGLQPGHVSLEFQLKNGTKHTVLMGDKDFTGVSVYSVIDGGKSVALLPLSLYTSADKPLDDLRDRSVLHIEAGRIASFELKNPSGELDAAKQKGDDQNWEFTKPAGAAADGSNVVALLTAVGTGKLTAIVSENADNLSKYGLSNPAITLSTVDDKGQKSTLLVGKKQGDVYLARDASRSMVFTISEDLYKKLTQNFSDLRDKNLVHVTENDVNHIEIRNANATMDVSRKQGSDYDWTIDSPSDVKGKSASTWRIFTPLTSAKADEVIDHPSAEIAAKLAKPAVQVDLTEKNGTRLTLKISGAVGEFVYGQTSAGPAVYKLKKSILDDLNFKVSDLAS